MRRRVLGLLHEEKAFSDVVREAQQLVELALKAVLHLVGIDPPRWHDVGPVLSEHSGAFPPWFVERIPRLAEVSRWLRDERELALYGDVDVVPTERYTAEHAARAVEDAIFAAESLELLLRERSG